MEIIIIIFLLFLVGIFLYLLFRLIKWIVRSKTRRIWALSFIGAYILGILINTLFFKKMEFIQSKVYPDLYLIKNPISDNNLLDSIIKNMVIQKMDSQLAANKKQSGSALNFGMDFYKYYNGWGINPFGEAGTTHFIENEEDPGGFSSELLGYYQDYLIASFSVRTCKNDSLRYNGYLDYFKDGTIIKKDTIINLFQKTDHNY